MANKYMEQAIREAERFWYAFSVELRARYCQEEVEQHPDSPVAQFCLARASELRLLDMLRKIQKVCSGENDLAKDADLALEVMDADLEKLLAQYKDVKTD